MEDNAIYGVVSEVDYIKYSVRYRNKWWSYTIDYDKKTTTVKSDIDLFNNNAIKLNLIIPLNETNIVQSMERFEKLMILK